AGNQSQDRQRARPYRTADATSARRRGDRVAWYLLRLLTAAYGTKRRFAAPRSFGRSWRYSGHEWACRLGGVGRVDPKRSFQRPSLDSLSTLATDHAMWYHPPLHECPPAGGSHGKLHRTTKILSHVGRRCGSVDEARIGHKTRHGGEIMIRASFATATAVAATIVASLSGGQSALGQDESDQRLGRVHFQTSCNEVAQRRFDRGMRYQ